MKNRLVWGLLGNVGFIGSFMHPLTVQFLFFVRSCDIAITVAEESITGGNRKLLIEFSDVKARMRESPNLSIYD